MMDAVVHRGSVTKTTTKPQAEKEDITKIHLEQQIMAAKAMEVEARRQAEKILAKREAGRIEEEALKLVAWEEKQKKEQEAKRRAESERRKEAKRRREWERERLEQDRAAQRAVRSTKKLPTHPP